MTTIFRKNKGPFKARHIQLNSFIRKAVGEYAHKHGVTARVVVNKVERNKDKVIIDFKDSAGQAHVIHKELNRVRIVGVHRSVKLATQVKGGKSQALVGIGELAKPSLGSNLGLRRQKVEIKISTGNGGPGKALDIQIVGKIKWT